MSSFFFQNILLNTLLLVQCIKLEEKLLPEFYLLYLLPLYLELKSFSTRHFASSG